MALTKSIIHCLFDAEPDGFHPADAALRTLTVNLGFECQTGISPGDIAGDGGAAKAKQQELEADETAAQSLFGWFSRAVQDVEFRIFQAELNAPDTCLLTLLGEAEAQISDAKDLNGPAQVIAWLDKAAPKTGNIRHYWTTVADGGGEVLIDAVTAPATYRLRAAQSWNAPVAHRLWLTHILRLEGITSPNRYVILPFFGEPDPSQFPTTGTLVGEQYEFTYDPGGGLGMVACRTEALLAPDSFTIAPETASGFLTAEGYLKVDQHAEEFWRLTKWFEARAASLMSPAAALAGPGAGAGDEHGADAAYDALFAWSYEDSPGSPLAAPAAAWLAVASLTAVLDNIVVGIMKPVSGKDSSGDILAPLLQDVIDRFEKTVAAPFSLMTSDYRPALLNEALRSALAAHNLLFAKAVPLTTPDERKAFVTLLRQVHAVAGAEKQDAPERQLLDKLLTHFETQAATPISASLKDALQKNGPLLLRRALAEPTQRLEDETGAETAIVHMIELTERGTDKARLPRLFAEAYLAALREINRRTFEPAREAELLAAVETLFSESWTAYRSLLATQFNGAEAVRRAAASEFTRALLSVAMQDPRQMISAVTGANYYSARLLGSDASPPLCFADIGSSLVTIPLPPALDMAKLATFLKDAYASAVAPMKQLGISDSRFIPDSSPAPLPIQIAANIGGEEIDDFSRYFNGIAVAIRRIDTVDETDRWAHASLAELTWPVPSPEAPAEANVPAAIRPLLPAVSDGRGAMFIEYEGLPLAARTFENTAADEVVATPEEQAPFYTHGTHDPVSSGFAAIPRLAYGRTFQTFSFANTNAGSLPLALQADLPWMPQPGLAPPQLDGKPDPQLVLSTAYQRRTAIGQIAVNEAPAAKRPRRIGVPIDGVVPLCEDYPRTVVSSEGYTGVRDLFRNRDGAGTLTIPAAVERKIEWEVTGIVFSGRPRRLIARLFKAPPSGPFDTGIAQLALDFTEDFNFAAAGKLLFRIDGEETAAEGITRYFHVKCGGLTDRVELNSAGDVSEGWIRIAIEADSPACLSFAASDSGKPLEPAAPLLLLAPGTRWNDGLSEPVKVDVDTPRVGYLDFERWFSNADLRDAAFDAKTKAENRDAADALRRALLTAYVLRDADEELARRLDRLPDPAVAGLRIELAVQDQVSHPSLPVQTAFKDIYLENRLLEIATKIGSVPSWTPSLLKQLIFDEIEKEFRFSVTLEAGDFHLSKEKLTARVPAGTVARLSLDALVPHRHFAPQGNHPAVLHGGLKQAAARVLTRKLSKEEEAKEGASTREFLAYPSAAIRIETMWDGMHEIDVAAGGDEAAKPAIALVADMIAVRPIERSRRYDLQTREEFRGPGKENSTRQWRLLSEIDVTSQRWRPSGRPIYNHIDPLHFRDETALPQAPSATKFHAAMPLKEREQGSRPEKHYPLARFEQEAFFDRPNIDSQTITQRLLPLPAATVLEQHFWDAPSATYFRHRFTLRSRYAGALKDIARREVKAWITDRSQRKTPADAWTLRVAMLADLSRMVLTRPQQRALIPLTIAPRHDGERAATPPVLSILQEPPFSRGGLADRIAAEIKTGFGYGFEGADHPVEILDSHKEIGPDPRLTYRALDANAALATVLNAEGPIGLTFDAVNAPAPAFPNSMVSLSPVSLIGAKHNLEEHFLGVSMRRYIDPNWTIEGNTSDPSKLDAERCWWIDLEPPVEGHEPEDDEKEIDLLLYTARGVEEALLTLVPEGTDVVARVVKAAIDGGVAGASKDKVAVARWRRDFVGRLGILHQPVMPGRYSTSLFVLPAKNRGNVMLGESSSPLPACSFEWGLPKTGGTTAVTEGDAKEAVPVAVTLNAKGATARPAMASAPTFLAWTRTGRDFDTVHSPESERGAGTPRVPVRDLLANLDSKSSELTFDRSGVAKGYWLCSSTFRKPFPLHVQRHLAVLTTRYLDEPGRPVETFRRTALLVGRSVERLFSESGDNSNDEDCLRLVEFETPAMILCSAAGTIPETYKHAYFDLISTGFTPHETSGAASARLFFRFTGPPAHLAKFRKLTVGVCFSEKGAGRHTVPIEFGSLPEATYVIAVELFLERAAATGSLTYRRVLLYSNGKRSAASPVSPAPAPGERGLLAVDNYSPGFFLDIEAEGDGDAGEFWTDVSLLHSPRPVFEPRLDFDWLFSRLGGAKPALDVAPAGLNAMVEAQARIVSVSPPIPVRLRKSAG